MIYLTHGAPGAGCTFPHPARPLSLETTGDPRSATSAAPQGCVGLGMGSMPMSPCVQPVPAENATTASATAQGIVTRMGQDRNGLGGAAIEPVPEGMRPGQKLQVLHPASHPPAGEWPRVPPDCRSGLLCGLAAAHPHAAANGHAAGPRRAPACLCSSIAAAARALGPHAHASGQA